MAATPPGLKFEEQGGPALRDLADIIRNFGDPREVTACCAVRRSTWPSATRMRTPRTSLSCTSQTARPSGLPRFMTYSRPSPSSQPAAQDSRCRRTRIRASASAEMPSATWLPGSRSKPSDSAYSRVLFYRTASLFALVMSKEIFGCAVAGCTVKAGSKRRSGWRSTAPPAPMTTTPNRPRTANRTKLTGRVGNSPRKYAAVRNTTRNCAAPISRWPRRRPLRPSPAGLTARYAGTRQAHTRRGSLGRRAPARDGQARENGIPRRLGRREDHRTRPGRGPRSRRPARVPGQPQMAGAWLS